METKTILIVDDALTNRVLLKRYLEDDYNIIEAENGQRAIDIINEQNYNRRKSLFSTKRSAAWISANWKPLCIP